MNANFFSPKEDEEEVMVDKAYASVEVIPNTSRKSRAQRAMKRFDD